jgi:hypothetical protein
MKKRKISKKKKKKKRHKNTAVEAAALTRRGDMTKALRRSKSCGADGLVGKMLPKQSWC